MPYTAAFFGFQLQFAARVAERFQLPFAQVLRQYTTFSKTLGHPDWPTYAAHIEHVPDRVAYTYQTYLQHRMPDPAPDDPTFLGHRLFGCFYYLIRDETTVRIHFTKNDRDSQRPLSHARLAVRSQELQRMFAHIRMYEPQAATVLGNSWMYNLEAYRRLYPPVYTQHLPVSDEAEFQFLAFWGQCFDYACNPKPAVTHHILDALESLTELDQLRWCFPYQILQPACAIEHFYRFYENMFSRHCLVITKDARYA